MNFINSFSPNWLSNLVVKQIIGPIFFRFCPFDWHKIKMFCSKNIVFQFSSFLPFTFVLSYYVSWRCLYGIKGERKNTDFIIFINSSFLTINFRIPYLWWFFRYILQISLIEEDSIKTFRVIDLEIKDLIEKKQKIPQKSECL